MTLSRIRQASLCGVLKFFLAAIPFGISLPTPLSLRAADPPVKAPTVPHAAAAPKAAPAVHPAAPAAHPVAPAAHPVVPGGATPRTVPGAAPRTAPGIAPRTATGIPGHPPGASGRPVPGGGLPAAGRMEQGRNGTQFQRGHNGQVSTIHHGDMTIQRGPAGSFRSERMRPDGSRLVAHRGGGYVEHRYQYGGHDVYRRNYYYRGAYYPRYYNPYMYRGFALNVYAPAYYYGPGFYSYAYAPWATPIAYAWGFAGNPWYGYYGSYFTPYPVYASPSLWLTDYLVSQSLQQAYQDRAAANALVAANSPGPGDQQQFAAAPAPLTPEVKQAIANEVRAQIALENSERQTAATTNAMPDPASSGIARLMADNTSHVFVASAGLTVQSAGQECAITEGDVLQLNAGQLSNGTEAAAVVLASKGSDCGKGSLVSIAYTDLQDMQNHMRATIDLGMGELQKKQGQNGIPAMPLSAAAPPVEAPYAKVAPPPDPSEAAEVTKETQDATQAEQDALTGAMSGPRESAATTAAAVLPPADSTSPGTVDIGQSFAQVEAIMGRPTNVAKAGTKTIYIYPLVKVTFNAGKVSEVQ